MRRRFFKHEQKEGFREPLPRTRDFHVRPVTVETGNSANNRLYYHAETKSGTFGTNKNSRTRNDQVKSPLCFICSRRTFFMNCDKFITLSLKEKR